MPPFVDGSGSDARVIGCLPDSAASGDVLADHRRQLRGIEQRRAGPGERTIETLLRAELELLPLELSGETLLTRVLGVQTVTDIEARIANAQTASTAAQSRHQQTSTVLTNFLQSIEGVDNT